MAKFDVISSHGLGGGKFCDVGDVIDIHDPREASYRVRIGLVKPHVEPAAPAPGEAPADPASTSPASPESAEPAAPEAAAAEEPGSEAPTTAGAKSGRKK